MHLKLKFCENVYAYNLCFNCPMTLEFCTEHGSLAAVRCVKCQNDLTTDTDDLVERVLRGYAFKVIPYFKSHQGISDDTLE